MFTHMLTCNALSLRNFLQDLQIQIRPCFSNLSISKSTPSILQHFCHSTIMFKPTTLNFYTTRPMIKLVKL